MTRALTTVLFFTYFYCCQTLSAQDLHFSNYSYAPLYLNPAQTGSFAGTYRISGIAREQFHTFITQPYRTGMVAVDAPVNFGLRDRDWFGIGLSLYQDQVGELALTSRGALLSLSYHIAFDKKQRTYLTLAGQQGFFTKTNNGKYNPQDRIEIGPNSLDQSLQVTTKPDGTIVPDFNLSSTDFNAGIQLNSQIGKASAFEMGAAMYHIFVPGQDRNIIPRRFTVHTSLYAQMSKKMYLEPSIYYSRAASFNNTVIQLKNHFRLGKTVRKGRKKVTTNNGSIMLGLGYRLKDALQILTGFEYKKWQFGLSYDLTLSTASAYNNYYGALEIGIKRIFITNTTPEVKPIMLCPRL